MDFYGQLFIKNECEFNVYRIIKFVPRFSDYEIPLLIRNEIY